MRNRPVIQLKYYCRLLTKMTLDFLEINDAILLDHRPVGFTASTKSSYIKVLSNHSSKMHHRSIRHTYGWTVEISCN